MKVGLNILVVMAAIASTFLMGHFIHVTAQLPARVNRTPLTAVDAYKGMREDVAAEATGIPRADLVIKDMCYENPEASMSYIGILIANIGTVDAGEFELGIEYVNAEGTPRLGLDKVNGLKAGEEQWMTEAHICCGWGGQSLVYGSVSFVAIADPKYYAKSMFTGGGYSEVKSVIPESNEGNNKMSGTKSELRSCTAVPKADRPAPVKVQPITPRPRIESARPPRP